MIKAGVIGATGYAGSELVRILHNHPQVSLDCVTSRSYKGKKYSDVYENYRHNENIILEDENIEKMSLDLDVIFLALPHGEASVRINENILKNTKIIDLGADFRLHKLNTYESWYNVKHNCPEILKEAVYGLCELHRNEIKNARIIANPGCYTTCSILSLYPLVKEGLIETDSIIIDAKSGVTGAGRTVNINNIYCEVNESIKAYKIASHRHTPEIEQELSEASGCDIVLNFTPHLVPMNRGIISTCYANIIKNAEYVDILKAYEKYYSNEYFIRLTKNDIFPETKWVKGSNFCDIGFKIDKRTNRIIVVGAIDNLVKGAAGQAVQNMNILFGFDEREGLDNISAFPI